MDALIIALTIFCGFTVLVNVGIAIFVALTWRGCMKMYTEYFKDRSISHRQEDKR